MIVQFYKNTIANTASTVSVVDITYKYRPRKTDIPYAVVPPEQSMRLLVLLLCVIFFVLMRRQILLFLAFIANLTSSFPVKEMR